MLVLRRRLWSLSLQLKSIRKWCRAQDEYFAPAEISDAEEKNAFYEQLNAVQEILPKGDDLNNNMTPCSDMGKHGFGDRNDNGRKSAAF